MFYSNWFINKSSFRKLEIIRPHYPIYILPYITIHLIKKENSQQIKLRLQLPQGRLLVQLEQFYTWYYIKIKVEY